MTRPADHFFKERLTRLIESSSSILDIGGGLRIDKGRSNRIDARALWIRDLMQKKGVQYRILDYVDTYHPDLVGDIQDLPLPDASEEAIVCVSVLEHVENPFKAAAELLRVLRPGGQCLVYVPFLFYYHAEHGYYGDYWRFTEDSLRLLFKDFSTFELQNARGPLETLVRLSPLGRAAWMCDIGFMFDRVAGKLGSRQTSGYYLYLVK